MSQPTARSGVPQYTCATCDGIEPGDPAGFCGGCLAPDGGEGPICSRCVKTHTKGHYPSHQFVVKLDPPMPASPGTERTAEPGGPSGADILAKFGAKPSTIVCPAHGAPFDLRCLSCAGTPLLCSTCFTAHVGHEMSTLKALAATQCEQLQRALLGGGPPAETPQKPAPTGDATSPADAAAAAGGSAAAPATPEGTKAAPAPATPSAAVMELARRRARRVAAEAEALSQRAQSGAGAINAAIDAIVAAANARRGKLIEALMAARDSARAAVAAEAQAANAALEEAQRLAADIRAAVTVLPDVDVVVHGPRMMARVAEFAVRAGRSVERPWAAPLIDVSVVEKALVDTLETFGTVAVRVADAPPPAPAAAASSPSPSASVRRLALTTHRSDAESSTARRRSGPGSGSKLQTRASSSLDPQPHDGGALRETNTSPASSGASATGAGGTTPPHFISPLRAVNTLPEASMRSILAAAAVAQDAAAGGGATAVQTPRGPPARLTGAIVDGNYTSPCMTRSGTLYLPKDGEAAVHVLPGDGSAAVTLPLEPLGLSRSTVAAAFDEASFTLFLADSTRLVALDPSNSSIRWSTPSGSFDDCYGVAVLPHAVVACSRHESLIHVHRLADGVRLSTIEAKCPIHVAADAASGSVFASVGFGSCSVHEYHWNGRALIARGAVKAASHAESWRPLAVIPPPTGSFSSYLVVGTNGSPSLKVLSLPDLELVHEARLDGMKITGCVRGARGRAGEGGRGAAVTRRPSAAASLRTRAAQRSSSATACRGPCTSCRGRSRGCRRWRRGARAPPVSSPPRLDDAGAGAPGGWVAVGLTSAEGSHAVDTGEPYFAAGLGAECWD